MGEYFGLPLQAAIQQHFKQLSNLLAESKLVSNHE
jgi:hypothetical protein